MGWGGVGISEPPSPVLGQGQMLLGRWLQALGFGEPWPRTPHRAACWSRGAVGAAEAALCWGQFLTPEAEAYARAGAIQDPTLTGWEVEEQRVSTLGGDSYTDCCGVRARPRAAQVERLGHGLNEEKVHTGPERSLS